jgi:hypothetical protein
MLRVVKGTYINGHVIFDESPGNMENKKVIVTFLDDAITSKKNNGENHPVIFGSLKGKISVPDNFDEPLDYLKDYMY